MAPRSDNDRIFAILEKINDKLARVESRTAVIEDQNIGQFRELEHQKNMLSSFGLRCDSKHAELEEDRHQKDTQQGERLQRLETIVWLLGSSVSVLALILGGGVLAKYIGG